MEHNIIEDTVGADLPKVLDDEQMLIYMALSDYLHKGAASFNMRDFIVNNGHVSIRGGTTAEVNRITSIDRIYEDKSKLPVDGVFNGTVYVAATDGGRPYALYQYDSTEKVWVYKDTVREDVIYYVLSTTYDEDVLYRWKNSENAFYPLNVLTPQTFITNIKPIYNNLTALKNGVINPNNGDTAITLTNGSLPAVIYLYESATDSWKFRDIVNPQTLYININPSDDIGAGCILKWIPSTRSFQVLYDPTHPEELPSITEADDGKILEVQNGKWVARKRPVYDGEAELLPDYVQWSGGTY